MSDERFQVIVVGAGPAGCAAAYRLAQSGCEVLLMERGKQLGSKNDSGELLFDHVGCLECGNCRLVCERLRKSTTGYKWNYPKNGQGVIFRQG